MIFGVSLLNHTLASSLSVVGNALHMISSETSCRRIRVLNDSRRLSESRKPSYASTCSIRNLARRGKEVIYAVKGESDHWTSSSRLVDTHPLMAFITMSIFSFIIYISYAVCIALLSSSGQCLPAHLGCLGCCFLPDPPFLIGLLSKGDYHSVPRCLICRANLRDVICFSGLLIAPTLGCVGWVTQLLWPRFALVSPRH